MKMRWILQSLPSLTLLLLLAPACGEWTDRPFQDGEATVRGQLTGSFRAESAWVGVLGDPEAFVEVDEEGFFELVDLPSGTFELIASDGEDASARQEITLYNRRDRELQLPMGDGVRVEGQVLLSDGEVLWATVSLPELPVEATEVTSSEGRFELRGLPPGELQLEIDHPGYATYHHQLHQTEPGERVILTAILGPTSTGSRASCEPCEEGSDCASGLCVEGESSDEGATCAVLCIDDLDCPGAYSCHSLEGSRARACQPKDASCEAVRATVERRSCGQDAACGESGLCLDGICTLSCSEDEQCPGSGRCLPHVSEPIEACE